MIKSTIILLLFFAIQVNAKNNMNCKYKYDIDYIDNVYDNDELVEINLSHEFIFEENKKSVITKFLNPSNKSYVVQKWNNFDSPLIKVFEYYGGKLKYVPGNEVYAEEIPHIKEKYNCETVVLYGQNLVQEQTIISNLVGTYKFEKNKKYCIESKELFLLDIINSKVIKFTSPAYLLWSNNENWLQKSTETFDSCKELIWRHIDIENLIKSNLEEKPRTFIKQEVSSGLSLITHGKDAWP